MPPFSSSFEEYGYENSSLLLLAPIELLLWGVTLLSLVASLILPTMLPCPRCARCRRSLLNYRASMLWNGLLRVCLLSYVPLLLASALNVSAVMINP